MVSLVPVFKVAAVTRFRPDKVNRAACGPLKLIAPFQVLGVTEKVPTVTPAAIGPVAVKVVPEPLKGAAGVNMMAVAGGDVTVIVTLRVAA